MRYKESEKELTDLVFRGIVFGRWKILGLFFMLKI